MKRVKCSTHAKRSTHVNFDKIRKAYLKASLRYHPDKAARHGFTEAEATDAMHVREWRVDLDLTL